ncbi:TPA: SDR family oxidoreductase [Clostridioides difficile]|uniref:SDR family oxidoreductase n=1 Tax=Clostridioides difficile TaxID=1496 RepID=UPI00038CB046|nr:SDR family oxidoreductase [Clostridioides difficile]EGT4625349.1 SDR family oxidoreductase [Clostridioides difficile]ELX4576140.1 SDR family oxidoreductase [Clostridioides difficile]EQK76213.1 enoyl-(Acyl carrier) reductase family protein [Clostridioides difficile CD113]MBH6986770.1 SDR family oxidoreductase [Clostridioides difficile]MBH7139343.1 SDR family oxidoreductase [Clostridioides difficile]
MKNILITEGHEEYNKTLALDLVKKGNNIYLLNDKEVAEDFEGFSNITIISTVLKSEDDYFTLAQMFENQYGKIDMLIHGFSICDESALFSDSYCLINTVKDKLKKLFFLNKHFGNLMVKKKDGSILFPILMDTLEFSGYPASPILNQAKISMVKCLARELNAFKIKVNAITLGYYDNQFEKEARKQMRKELEIYALKPRLYCISELLGVFEFFLTDSANVISGQNIHVGAGAETFL